MTTKEELRRAFGAAQRVAIERAQIHARVGISNGDGTYTLRTTTRPHRVWVTTDGGTTAEVANMGVPLIAGQPVILERVSGDLTATRIDHIRTVATMGSDYPSQPVAPHTHRIGFGLDDLVEELRFEPGLLYAGDDLEVRAKSFWYAQDGYWPDATTLDLAGSQPASGAHRWVRIGFDTTGPSLEAADGTAVPVTIPLNVADVASIALSSADIIPIGAIKLDGDQTTWHGPEDFVSTRTLLGIESGMGTDANAIHDNVAGEIAAVAEKGSPVAGDWVIIEDSEDSNNKKRAQAGNLPGGGGASLEFTITAGENLSERDHAYLNADNKFYQVDIDDATPKIGSFRVIITESGGILADATGSAQRIGVVDGFTGLTPGADVWASTTAGGYTETKPAPTDGGAQLAIVRIGVAVSATEILLTPQDEVTYAKRESLAEDGSLTIVHHSDPVGRTRALSCYAEINSGGSAITSYADTNQDEHVALHGPVGAGGSFSESAAGDDQSVGTLAAGEVAAGAEFQVTAGWLTQITFDLTGVVGSPGVLVWQIRDDDSPDPSSNVLLTGTISSPNTSGTNTVNIDEGELYIAGATSYWLVLKLQTYPGSTGNFYRWEGDGTSGTYSLRKSNDAGSTWGVASRERVTFSVTTSAATDHDYLAQGFQIADGADIGVAKVWLKKANAPEDDLTLKIYDNSGGDPNALVTNATSDTVDASSLAEEYGWIEFTFSTAPTLLGSTQYHLRLETSGSQSNTDYVLWGADGSSPGYGDGEFKSSDDNGASWDSLTMDACFEVYEEIAAYQEPRIVGSWGEEDGVSVVARFDDGSGSDGDTKTTFKNVYAGERDLTCIVRVG